MFAPWIKISPPPLNLIYFSLRNLPKQWIKIRFLFDQHMIDLSFIYFLKICQRRYKKTFWRWWPKQVFGQTRVTRIYLSHLSGKGTWASNFFKKFFALFCRKNSALVEGKNKTKPIVTYIVSQFGNREILIPTKSD